MHVAAEARFGFPFVEGWAVYTERLMVEAGYAGIGPAEGARRPRGVSKADAKIDYWAKDAAPSTTLRKWYAHDPDKWPEFKRRYFAELDAAPDALAALREALGRGTNTFVFSSKETELNNATALKLYLESD